MMGQAKVSIIIVGRNAEKTIRQCIESILTQGFDGMEVIFVDNNSSDDSKKIASEYQITVLSEVRRGSYIARNIGVKNASGEILVFTDSDCIAERDWISNLVTPIIEGNEVASLGAIQSAEKSDWSAIEQKTYDELLRGIEKGGYVSQAYTGNFAVKKNVFNELGGFDEDIIWNADTDFSLRILEKGYRIRYVPEAVVRHFHRTTLTQIFRRKFQQGYWATTVYKKNNKQPPIYGKMIKEIKRSVIFFFISTLFMILSFISPIRVVGYPIALLFLIASVYEFINPKNAIYLMKNKPFKEKTYQLTYFYGWRLGIIYSFINKNR